jgi:hypothetical protein
MRLLLIRYYTPSTRLLADHIVNVTGTDTVVVTDGLDPDVHSVMRAIFHRAPIVYARGG